MIFDSSTIHSVQVPHDDPLVVEVKVAHSNVKRVLIDSGSSADIITLQCLEKLKISKSDVQPLGRLLVGFGGQPTYPVGTIKLPTRIGQKGCGRNPMINYVVVDITLPYNIILGRPALNRIKAAISTYQLLLQYETDSGSVGKLYGNRRTGRECYMNSFKTSAQPRWGKEKGTSSRADSNRHGTIPNREHQTLCSSSTCRGV